MSLQPCERALAAEEREDRKDETPTRREVLGRAVDDAVQDPPAVDATVVGRRDGVAALAAGRRRHLGRVRADQVEPLAADRRVTIAEPGVPPPAIQRRGAAEGLGPLG